MLPGALFPFALLQNCMKPSSSKQKSLFGLASSFASDFSLFPTHLICPAISLWVDNVSVQDGFRRCMSNNSSKPMDHWVQKAQVAIGHASWKHISSQLLKGDANVEVRRKKSTKAKPSMAFGGYYLTTSVVLPTEEISLCTTSELLSLEFLFGTVVRFGVQVKRLGVSKRKQLEENDNLNVF